MAPSVSRLAEWAALTGEKLPDSLSDGRDDGDFEEFDGFERRR